MCSGLMNYLVIISYFSCITAFFFSLEQIRDGIKYIFAVAQNLTVQQEKETLEVLLKVTVLQRNFGTCVRKCVGEIC